MFFCLRLLQVYFLTAVWRPVPRGGIPGESAPRRDWDWWLFRKGYIHLHPSRIWYIHQTLLLHHSRDSKFLRVYSENHGYELARCLEVWYMQQSEWQKRQRFAIVAGVLGKRASRIPMPRRRRSHGPIQAGKIGTTIGRQKSQNGNLHGPLTPPQGGKVPLHMPLAKPRGVDPKGQRTEATTVSKEKARARLGKDRRRVHRTFPRPLFQHLGLPSNSRHRCQQHLNLQCLQLRQSLSTMQTGSQRSNKIIQIVLQCRKISVQWWKSTRRPRPRVRSNLCILRPQPWTERRDSSPRQWQRSRSTVLHGLPISRKASRCGKPHWRNIASTKQDCKIWWPRPKKTLQPPEKTSNGSCTSGDPTECTGPAGRGDATGRPCRSRGREASCRLASYFASMCWISWYTSSFHASADDYLRRGERRTTWQTTTSIGAIRSFHAHGYTTVNDGSAFGRLIQSGKHDARNVPGSASIADAYGPLNIVDCAACHADSNFETVMLSYRHSIRNEPRFCSVFRAFLNALKSRMQVLSDHWAHGIYDFGLPILPQADASRPKFNHQVPQTFAVRFDLRISLHLVDESTHLSSSQCILHDDLRSWKAKPWKLKHRKQKRIDAEGSDAFFQESSCDGSTMCCSNQDPSQDSKISSFHLFSQSTSEETQVASRVSAPLSPVAVLSFPRDCNDTADNCPCMIPSVSCKHKFHPCLRPKMIFSLRLRAYCPRQ